MTIEQSGMLDPTTPFMRVEAVRCEIIRDGIRDECQSEADGHFYQLLAMQKLGVFEPLTEEYRALNAMLTQLGAGKRTAELAWRLFAQSL